MPSGIYKRNKINIGQFLLNQVPHNKGTQKKEVIKKVNLFNSGLPISCKIHGEHTNWRLHTGNNVQCKLCIAEHQKRKRELNPITYLLRDAKQRKLEYNLDEFFIKELLNKQENRCALSGTIFNDKNKISIDRIDSSKGYIKDNIQLVIFEVNRMKSNFTQDQFIEFCSLVSNWNIIK